MSETKRRKSHTPEFKAKLGLEALSGVKTIHQIAQENGVHPVQIGLWKKEIKDQAQQLFAGKRGPKPLAEHADPEARYSQIGKLKMELDWLKKKVWDQPVSERRTWIPMALDLARSCKAALTASIVPAKAVEAAQVPTPSVPSIRMQCALAGVSRATVYAHQRAVVADANDLVLCQLIDGQYCSPPRWGHTLQVRALRL